MRSTRVLVPGLAAFAALGLTAAACGGTPATPAEYSEVCVDEQGTRVDDDRCPEPGYSSSSGLHYVYVPHSHPVPAVGHPVTGGTHARPAGAAVDRAPAVGRGGFGGRAGGGAGG